MARKINDRAVGLIIALVAGVGALGGLIVLAVGAAGGLR